MTAIREQIEALRVSPPEGMVGAIPWVSGWNAALDAVLVVVSTCLVDLLPHWLLSLVDSAHADPPQKIEGLSRPQNKNAFIKTACRINFIPQKIDKKRPGVARGGFDLLNVKCLKI